MAANSLIKPNELNTFVAKIGHSCIIAVCWIVTNGKHQPQYQRSPTGKEPRASFIAQADTVQFSSKVLKVEVLLYNVICSQPSPEITDDLRSWSLYFSMRGIKVLIFDVWAYLEQHSSLYPTPSHLFSSIPLNLIVSVGSCATRKFPQVWCTCGKLNPILSPVVFLSESFPDAHMRKKHSLR